MALEFPNRMRTLNSGAGIITFSGYDGIAEIRFTLPVDILSRIHGKVFANTEAALSAFDTFRNQIEAAAKKIHARSHKTFYVIDRSSF